jgi:ubiquinone/menaquinone biosynthesis C-methylase UbiE
VDRCNNPLEKDFATLFDPSLLPPRGQVLDLGCGEGLYALLFAAEGYRVTGVDISPTALAWARQRAAEQGISNVHFTLGDVTAPTGFARAGFDLVLSVHCYHCLSNSQDRQAHLRESWRLLRPGGVFVFDNMAAPLDEDMPRFRIWHAERNAQVLEDETGVTTTTETTLPYVSQRGSTGIEVEMPTAMPLAHRFYGRLEHLTNQLADLGFEILKAEFRPPGPAHISEMKFVHGDNMIYARKPTAEN